MTQDGQVTTPNLLCRSFRIRGEQGYALLALMLMVSLLAIVAAAVAPSIAFQIRRDRETEMIHRAMQYRRAVRKFAKQTGRYPMTLEDLESTNGVRYLRKRYKDPITGREFRLLHMADIPAALGTGAGSGSLQRGASPNGAPGESTSPSAQDQAAAANEQNLSPSPGSQALPAGASSAGSLASSFSNQSDNQSTNQVFGGGVIIGIASTSARKTIREFDHRNQYNQWLFFYDPGYERPFEVQGPTPLTHPPAALQSSTSPASQPLQPAASQP
jgi:type II secretory pathway pseudopilin PulG